MALDPSNPLQLAAKDQGPFVDIGNTFKIGNINWRGAVVASPNAFYLLKRELPERVYGNYSLHVNSKLSREEVTLIISCAEGQRRTCNASDLPMHIRELVDPRKEHANRDVLVIPIQTVNRLSSSKLNNTIALKVQGDYFTITTFLVRYLAIPRELEALGWKLNAEGSPSANIKYDVTPPNQEPAPPVAPSKYAVQNWPIWARIILGIVGVALIIALKLARSMLLSHHW